MNVNKWHWLYFRTKSPPLSVGSYIELWSIVTVMLFLTHFVFQGQQQFFTRYFGDWCFIRLQIWKKEMFYVLIIQWHLLFALLHKIFKCLSKSFCEIVVLIVVSYDSLKMWKLGTKWGWSCEVLWFKNTLWISALRVVWPCCQALYTGLWWGKVDSD